MTDNPDDELDLFRPLTVSRQIRRVVETSVAIQQDPCPDRADFLHAVLCQVGMPRSRVEGRIFERQSGNSIIRIEAGAIFNGKKLVDQPLPYGTRPRLVMVHISTEAVRTKSRVVEIGLSTRDFLNMLGIDPTGGPRGGYTMFKKQMEALAACRMTLGMPLAGRNVTINTQPISRFEAWTQHDSRQRTLWPGVLELSQDFFDTLGQHAVPLDPRALSALKNSALALDIYSWLAHRLCRVSKTPGVKVSWANMREQFGQEYADAKNFKKKFKHALLHVKAVYPEARIEEATGGLLLRPSPPPVKKTQLYIKK